MRGRISWDMEAGLIASLLRFCYIELQFRLHNFAGPGVTIYKASYAPVNGNPHPTHPGGIWGIRQLKGKKGRKSPTLWGKIFSLRPN